MEFLYIFGGLVLLVLGGDYLVKGASGLALRFDVSPMLVGLTIVAFGTSAPELLVSVNAALKGKPDIAIGNVVGSNIANVGLILGMTAIIFPIAIQRRTLSFDWVMMMLATVVVYFFGFDRVFSRLEGVLLAGGLVSFVMYSFLHERRRNPNSEEAAGVDPSVKNYSLPVLILIVVGGCVALVFGADWLVEGAEVVARNFGVSDRVIALSLIAFGTSLPELAASVIAAFRGKHDISIGNIIGSNLYNLLAIIGITSMIEPIEASNKIMEVDIWWTIGFSFAVLPVGIIGMRIGRLGGALLVLGYLLYMYLVFMGDTP